jgi:putative SOS response-associated peptidase YedK
MDRTEASASIREIHHRMPAILKPEAYESWLDPDNHDLAALKQLLKSGIITQCLSTPTSRGQQIKDKQLSLFH